MRYPEPKERSAELLRLALAQMGRHVAAFNPVTFTVWYEYVAAMNPPLAAALDALATSKTALDDAAVMRLYRSHIAPANGEAMERIGTDMTRRMSKLAGTAAATGIQAGVYGEQLSGLSTVLASGDAKRLAPQLADVIAGTTQMRASIGELQQEVVAAQAEMSRLRADLDRAHGEALLDPLSGILNRKGFDQRLHALLEEAPEADATHCLVLLDIDHFKRVNDTHGHLMGDRVIQAVGEILRTTISEPSHAAARYGGEEFALLMPHTPLARCAELAESVRKRTKAMKIRNRSTQEVLLSVTISGGVTEMRRGDDASTFISRADAALYASKHAGRDRVTQA